jgi:hypothetical protein
MVTEPLSPAQLGEIGWENRQGLSDIPNQFHYYRLTADNRILWGGYDAVYFWGGKVNPELESRPETWAKLSEHFFETFPQLEGLVHPRLGRRHRHLQPLLRVLGPGDGRPRRVRPRLHRSRRGIRPLRRRGDARPARRPPVVATQTEFVRREAAAVPARTVPSSSASRPPAGRSTARTAPANAATCGSAIARPLGLGFDS